MSNQTNNSHLHPLRLAFIGGNGHHNLRGLLNQDGATSYEIAVASDGIDAQSADKLAQKLAENTTQKPPWFDSPQRLFDEFEPDIVSIGAVYGFNGEVAAQALERDIAVVSDKPVAANWEQLDRLKELLSDESNTQRVLLTEFPCRCGQPYRAAREAVLRSDIGEVILVTGQKSYRFGESRQSWYSDRASYGGTMLWVASHSIDAAAFCSGQEYSRVVGIQGNLSRAEYGTMEEYCIAMFELENGGGAVVHADYLRPAAAATHGDDRLRIAGSQGVLEVRDGRCHLISADNAETDITQTVEPMQTHNELLAAILGEGSGYFSSAHSLQMAEILLHARDGADTRQWQECR